MAQVSISKHKLNRTKVKKLAKKTNLKQNRFITASLPDSYVKEVLFYKGYFTYIAMVSTRPGFSALHFTLSNAASLPIFSTLAASIRPKSRISEATSPVQPV